MHVLVLSLLLFITPILVDAQPLSFDVPPEEICNICDSTGLGMVCELRGLRDDAQTYLDSLTSVASPTEVSSYINCFLKKNPDRLQKYNQEYEILLQGVAIHFGVPMQLLQCKPLVETSFDEGSGDSSAGARGLCQFTEQTVGHVSDIVGNGRANQNVNDTQLTPYSRFKRDQWIQWNNYFSDIGYPGGAPQEIKYDPEAEEGADIVDPQVCLAASAIYYKDLMIQLGASGELDFWTIAQNFPDGESEEASLNLMLLMAASYNTGAGNVSKLINSVMDTPNSLKEIVQLIESGDGENAKYVKKMRNCLERDNFDPPPGWPDPPTCSEDEKQNQYSGELLDYMLDE